MNLLSTLDDFYREAHAAVARDDDEAVVAVLERGAEQGLLTPREELLLAVMRLFGITTIWPAAREILTALLDPEREVPGDVRIEAAVWSMYLDEFEPEGIEHVLVFSDLLRSSGVGRYYLARTLHAEQRITLDQYKQEVVASVELDRFPKNLHAYSAAIASNDEEREAGMRLARRLIESVGSREREKPKTLPDLYRYYWESSITLRHVPEWQWKETFGGEERGSGE